MFKKIRDGLQEKIKVTNLEIIVAGTKEKPYFEIKYKEVGKEDYNIGYSSYDLNNVFNWKEERFEIVNQVEAEYNNDMVYQLAMKYALCLTQYGVDVTEKLETATQNAMALEKAYIRGRQDECDRFSEWRDRHNNGWIPCSERLPEDKQRCLVTARIYFTPDHVDEPDNYIGVDFNTYSSRFGWLGDNEVIAWQPLPEPYTPKGE